jgi:hypothetical protein
MNALGHICRFQAVVTFHRSLLRRYSMTGEDSQFRDYFELALGKTKLYFDDVDKMVTTMKTILKSRTDGGIALKISTISMLPEAFEKLPIIDESGLKVPRD